MNEFLLLGTLIITFPFHTEHNILAPEFSRNTSTYATALAFTFLLPLSLSLSVFLSLSLSSLSLSLSVFLCWGWWRKGNKITNYLKKLNILMVYRLNISNLFYLTHNISMVDSQWTQNFFVRKTHVKIQSCSCVKFHHTEDYIVFYAVSAIFGHKTAVKLMYQLNLVSSKNL